MPSAEGLRRGRWLCGNAMLRPWEAFARAYAQYVAWKNGDPRMPT